MNKQEYIKKAEEILSDFYEDIDDGVNLDAMDYEFEKEIFKKAREALYQLHLEGVREAEKKLYPFIAYCSCGDSLERSDLYPNEATYYCMGCDKTFKLEQREKLKSR